MFTFSAPDRPQMRTRPCGCKGNKRAITIPIGSNKGHYVTLCPSACRLILILPTIHYASSCDYHLRRNAPLNPDTEQLSFRLLLWQHFNGRRSARSHGEDLRIRLLAAVPDDADF